MDAENSGLSSDETELKSKIAELKQNCLVFKQKHDDVQQKLEEFVEENAGLKTKVHNLEQQLANKNDYLLKMDKEREVIVRKEERRLTNSLESVENLFKSESVFRSEMMDLELRSAQSERDLLKKRYDEDWEKLKESVFKLTGDMKRRLNEMYGERDELQRQKHNAERELSFTKSELLDAQCQSVELTKQVKRLLYHVEHEGDLPDQDESPNDPQKSVELHGAYQDIVNLMGLHVSQDKFSKKSSLTAIEGVIEKMSKQISENELVKKQLEEMKVEKDKLAEEVADLNQKNVEKDKTMLELEEKHQVLQRKIVENESRIKILNSTVNETQEKLKQRNLSSQALHDQLNSENQRLKQELAAANSTISADSTRKRGPPGDPLNAKMQIFLNGLDGAVVTLDVDNATQVADIKKFIEADNSVISYGSKVLDADIATLGELEIPDQATIDVNVRLLGGKVHGSLARAGKVRAQTPKVEKQEKKRQKRGRALRRLQFTKRFVNVAVSGPGRKRGPNSNMA
uniref:Ubiquitin-like domain-containing protein n=1 Tax=Panagrolaimus sp. JU765 TaxID=591449 RepID=A0AC34QKP5_9BILA